ncbi:Hypothetical Protein FCC1311_087412 [Hondaea fermentalgiana]|uniref:Sialate O-acetylesterase domain-containing protein n=1 Tax=Hondaea fermentalgiana TaxID=2315210 RepID=A0A2R5GNP8_9STRA|nr:Hypothetical Protein FCC1311_087412 [Hondaea fermentalgiana]|eukprot:GBG32517.1 Hypothetical Protein FCC1311_087412 [Hondaea fermentalgiana]
MATTTRNEDNDAGVRPQKEGMKNDDGENSLVWVLAGQSNMAGRGGLGSVPGKAAWTADSTRKAHAYGALGPVEGVEMLLTDEKGSRNGWCSACEPMHATVDINKVCGVGPGLLMAKNFVEKTSKRVRLIPCAVGGTSISEDKAIAYSARCSELFANFRRDFGTPSLLILAVVPIGDALRMPFLPQVRAGIEEAVKNDATGCSRIVYVPEGAQIRADGLHLTLESQALLAQALCSTLLQ